MRTVTAALVGGWGWGGGGGGEGAENHLNAANAWAPGSGCCHSGRERHVTQGSGGPRSVVGMEAGRSVGHC